jgi:predicted metal-dependent hydrolase
VREAQHLLDEGMPFHAHEVFEDAWKTGPSEEEGLWRGMAQLAVGVTHAARGNLTGAASLLRRGADNIATYQDPHELDIDGIRRWAEDLAADLEARPEPREPASLAPRLRAQRGPAS